MKDDLALVVAAIDFIEDHLKEKLSLDDIAHEVGFSKYYFTRLFTKYTNQSPYDYYRGRKITETIYYMLENKCKIIDAAFEYGYSSPEVFARACASVFGQSPSAVRKAIIAGTFKGIKTINKGYLWFVNSYEGQPNVEVYPELELSGVGYFSDSFRETLFHMKQEQLMSLKQQKGDLFKVSWLEKQPMGYMNFIGQQLDTESVGDALLTKKLPKMAYLVFDFVVDSSNLNYFYQYVFDYYLPSSPYELVSPYSLEKLAVKEGRRVSRLYIPIIPKHT